MPPKREGQPAPTRPPRAKPKAPAPTLSDALAEKDVEIWQLRRRIGSLLRGRRFRTIGEYYADDPDRERSGEVDYGVQWVEARTTWPNYRVSWIENTGEIYAVKLTDHTPVEILGWAASRDEAERLLDGWAEQFPNTLAWARARLAP